MCRHPKESLPVLVIYEDVLLGVAEGGDVVDGSGELDAQRSDHGMESSSLRCTIQDLTLLCARYFSIYDGIGSTLALTNQSGTPAVQYSYEPFGKTQSSNPSVANPFQFTGRENDGTGLMYYRARYYSPIFARFIREDPIGLAGGFNFYSYVLNNVPNNVDPLGLCVIGFGAQNGIMIAATNDGNQSVDPFVASNATIDSSNGPISTGTYPIGPTRRYGVDGASTPRGRTMFDSQRNRQQAFGDAFIPIDPVPGRTGIGIHAKFPDTSDLKKTEGCIRVHNNDVNELANFLENNCKNEPNFFIKY